MSEFPFLDEALGKRREEEEEFPHLEAALAQRPIEPSEALVAPSTGVPGVSEPEEPARRSLLEKIPGFIRAIPGTLVEPFTSRTTWEELTPERRAALRPEPTGPSGLVARAAVAVDKLLENRERRKMLEPKRAPGALGRPTTPEELEALRRGELIEPPSLVRTVGGAALRGELAPEVIRNLPVSTARFGIQIAPTIAAAKAMGGTGAAIGAELGPWGALGGAIIGTIGGIITGKEIRDAVAGDIQKARMARQFVRVEGLTDEAAWALADTSWDELTKRGLFERFVKEPAVGVAGIVTMWDTRDPETGEWSAAELWDRFEQDPAPYLWSASVLTSFAARTAGSVAGKLQESARFSPQAREALLGLEVASYRANALLTKISPLTWIEASIQTLIKGGYPESHPGVQELRSHLRQYHLQRMTPQQAKSFADALEFQKPGFWTRYRRWASTKHGQRARSEAVKARADFLELEKGRPGVPSAKPSAPRADFLELEKARPGARPARPPAARAAPTRGEQLAGRLAEPLERPEMGYYPVEKPPAPGVVVTVPKPTPQVTVARPAAPAARVVAPPTVGPPVSATIAAAAAGAPVPKASPALRSSLAKAANRPAVGPPVNHYLFLAEKYGTPNSENLSAEDATEAIRAIDTGEVGKQARWRRKGGKRPRVLEAVLFLADQKHLTPEQRDALARKAYEGKTFKMLNTDQLRALGDHIGKTETEALRARAGVAPKAEVQPALVEGEKAVPLKEITEPGPVERAVAEKRAETARREAERAKVREPKLFTTGEGVKGQMAIEDVLAKKPKQEVWKSSPAEGQPLALQGWHGSGRAKREAAYAPGVEGPVLGEGFYIAQSAKVAERYGPNVAAVTVQLQNPFVIDSNEKLYEAWGGVSDPMTNEKRAPLLRRLRERIEAQGYDGVFVYAPWDRDVNAQGQSIKRVREIFGHTQVVQFKKEAKRVAERPAEAVPEREARGVEAIPPAALDLQAVATRIERAAGGKNIAVRVDEDAAQVVVDNAPSQGFSPQEVAPELNWQVVPAADRVVGRVKEAAVTERREITPVTATDEEVIDLFRAEPKAGGVAAPGGAELRERGQLEYARRELEERAEKAEKKVTAKQKAQVSEARARVKEAGADWRSNVLGWLRDQVKGSGRILIHEPGWLEDEVVKGKRTWKGFLFTADPAKAGPSRLDEVVTELVAEFPQLRAAGVDPESATADEQMMEWLSTQYRSRADVVRGVVREIEGEAASFRDGLVEELGQLADERAAEPTAVRNQELLAKVAEVKGELKELEETTFPEAKAVRLRDAVHRIEEHIAQLAPWEMEVVQTEDFVRRTRSTIAAMERGKQEVPRWLRGQLWYLQDQLAEAEKQLGKDVVAAERMVAGRAVSRSEVLAAIKDFRRLATKEFIARAKEYEGLLELGPEETIHMRKTILGTANLDAAKLERMQAYLDDLAQLECLVSANFTVEQARERLAKRREFLVPIEPLKKVAVAAGVPEKPTPFHLWDQWEVPTLYVFARLEKRHNAQSEIQMPTIDALHKSAKLRARSLNELVAAIGHLLPGPRTLLGQKAREKDLRLQLYAKALHQIVPLSAELNAGQRAELLRWDFRPGTPTWAELMEAHLKGVPGGKQRQEAEVQFKQQFGKLRVKLTEKDIGHILELRRWFNRYGLEGQVEPQRMLERYWPIWEAVRNIFWYARKGVAPTPPFQKERRAPAPMELDFLALDVPATLTLYAHLSARSAHLYPIVKQARQRAAEIQKADPDAGKFILNWLDGVIGRPSETQQAAQRAAQLNIEALFEHLPAWVQREMPWLATATIRRDLASLIIEVGYSPIWFNLIATGRNFTQPWVYTAAREGWSWGLRAYLPYRFRWVSKAAKKKYDEMWDKFVKFYPHFSGIPQLGEGFIRDRKWWWRQMQIGLRQKNPLALLLQAVRLGRAAGMFLYSKIADYRHNRMLSWWMAYDKARILMPQGRMDWSTALPGWKTIIADYIKQGDWERAAIAYANCVTHVDEVLYSVANRARLDRAAPWLVMYSIFCRNQLRNLWWQAKGPWEGTGVPQDGTPALPPEIERFIRTGKPPEEPGQPQGPPDKDFSAKMGRAVRRTGPRWLRWFAMQFLIGFFMEQLGWRGMQVFGVRRRIWGVPLFLAGIPLGLSPPAALAAATWSAVAAWLNEDERALSEGLRELRYRGKTYYEPRGNPQVKRALKALDAWDGSVEKRHYMEQTGHKEAARRFLAYTAQESKFYDIDRTLRNLCSEGKYGEALDFVKQCSEIVHPDDWLRFHRNKTKYVKGRIAQARKAEKAR